jgi:hypothetical protein
MGLGVKVSQCLLFFFNLIFWLAGLALIIIGGIAKSHLSHYVKWVNYIDDVAVFVIVLGSIIFIISFFGCCGAWNKHYCMLITFSILMMIMLLVVIGAVVAAFVIRNKVESLVEPQLKDGLKTYNKSNKASSDLWNFLQKDFKCCGISNYTDWSENVFFKGNDSVPDSCCFTNFTAAGCGYGQLKHPTHIYTQGCVKSFEDYIKKHMAAAGAVAAAVAVIMIIGIFFACVLANASRHEYQYV